MYRVLIPSSPVVRLLNHFRLVGIQIRSHQIIIIAVLRVCLTIPCLTCKTENTSALPGIIPVRSAEMGSIPLEIRILPGSSRKRELGPRPDLLLIADILITVCAKLLLNHDILCAIRTHTVIKHHIADDRNFILLQHLYGLQIILFCPVLCCNRFLLIKLSEIIHIIYIIADTAFSRCSLVSRRQPYHIDSCFLQRRCLLGKPFPVQSVVRKIPLKILHHCTIITHSASPSLSLHNLYYNDSRIVQIRGKIKTHPHFVLKRAIFLKTW